MVRKAEGCGAQGQAWKPTKHRRWPFPAVCTRLAAGRKRNGINRLSSYLELRNTPTACSPRPNTASYRQGSMAAGTASSEPPVAHDDLGKSDYAMPAVPPSEGHPKQPLSSDAVGRWKRIAGKAVSAVLFASMWFGESPSGSVALRDLCCGRGRYIC
jgi:hypothetical protein